MKTYVVGGDNGYARFLDGVELVDELKDAELVIFTGGSDVSPDFYGRKKHPSTYCNVERDKREKQIFSEIKPNQLVLGICRGLKIWLTLNEVNLSGKLRCQPAAKP